LLGVVVIFDCSFDLNDFGDAFFSAVLARVTSLCNDVCCDACHHPVHRYNGFHIRGTIWIDLKSWNVNGLWFHLVSFFPVINVNPSANKFHGICNGGIDSNIFWNVASKPFILILYTLYLLNHNNFKKLSIYRSVNAGCISCPFIILYVMEL